MLNTMISTKNIITKLEEIPQEWIFEFYLKLPEKLSGQDIKLKSLFNPNEKNPSMYIYYSEKVNGYKFKDFSTDESGNGVDLVKRLYNLPTLGESIQRIITDYNKWLIDNKEGYEIKSFKIQQKFKIIDFTTREWTKDDESFWTKFGIGSTTLDEYKVVPLKDYTLCKLDDQQNIRRTLQGIRLYGYLKKDGTLYKVYQPMITEYKFLKMHNYLQGSEQLTFTSPYLIICSSLKDLMSFRNLKFTNVEVIAPDSENTLISEHTIESLKRKYKSICTLFDNDEAGIRAMKKYKERYNIPYVHLELHKDLSDAIAAQGIMKVREVLTPLIRKILK